MNAPLSSSSQRNSSPASNHSDVNQDQPETGAQQSHPTGARALVLGGGGSTGNAWLIGVIAGLAEAGLDLTQADLIVGTSAGATTAAQITSASPAELLAATLAAPPQHRPGPTGSGGGNGTVRAAADNMERTRAIIAAATDAADMRRRMGAAAIELAAASGDSRQTQWRATVAARLPSQQWPHQRLLIAAVDAGTGEPVVFDRESGIELADAIAASCSSGFAYRIGDRQYIDGGYRRNENADLAAGYQRVLVLSPFGGQTRHPPAWGTQLATQIEELRAGGSRVETIVPERDLTGANAMDLSLRLPAAQTGYNQGIALAAHLARFWR
jgi:NTE family protein